jgi:hypothetical protein
MKLHQELSRRMLLGAAVAALIVPRPTWALEPPLGEIILTVGGAIQQANENGAAVFDMAMLEALPKASFKTQSPWFQQETLFEGTPLSSLLDAVGAKGTSLSAVAINDYAVEIPVEDAYLHKALLAYKVDGEYLPVRKKGPLWIVYDFGSNSKLRSEVYYTRSIWQLKSIMIS